MSNGRKGAQDLTANTAQSVGQCQALEAMIVSVNVCNRNNVPAKIRIAVTDSENSFDDLAHYIEYDIELAAKGTLLRTGITVSHTQFVTVQSNLDGVNAVTWGVEYGVAPA